MKKNLQKLLAGALALLLCVVPVYGDGASPEPVSLATAADDAEEITLPYSGQVNPSSQLVDIYTDGNYYPGFFYAIDLQQNDIVNFQFSAENGYDTIVKVFNSELGMLQSFDPDNYREYGTQGVFTAAEDDTYYFFCGGFDIENTLCDLSFQKITTTSVTFKELAAGAIAVETTPYTSTIMLGEIYDSDSETYAQMYKLEAEKDDYLTVIFGNYDEYLDTVVDLYLEKDGTFIPYSDVYSEVYGEAYYYDSDPDNFGEYGTIQAVNLPASGTWYLYCAGYDKTEIGLCDVRILLEKDTASPMDFTDKTTDCSGEKWSWDASEKCLTLKDKFNISAYLTYPLIILPGDSTIVVEGEASINALYDCILVRTRGLILLSDYITPSLDFIVSGDSSEPGTLTVQLKKNAHLSLTSEYGIGIASDNIESPVDFILTGDSSKTGTLEVSAPSYQALLSSGGITAKNLTMNLICSNEPLYAINDIVIENSVLNLVSSDEEGIYTENGSITIRNSDITISSDEESIQGENDILIENSVLNLVSSDEEGIYSADGSITIRNSDITIVAQKEPIDACTFVTITGSSLDLSTEREYSLIDVDINTDMDEDAAAEDYRAALQAAYAQNISIDRSFYVYAADAEGTDDYIGEGPVNYSDITHINDWYFDESLGGWYVDYEYWELDDTVLYRLITADKIEDGDEGEDGEDGEDGEEETFNPLPRLLPLNVIVGEGGKASMSGNLMIALYDNRTIRFTAYEGYEIEDVIVNGVSVGAVSSYRIVAAVRAHTIEVKFAPVTAETTETVTE